MRTSVISMSVGFILLAIAALNAEAQMCDCMGGPGGGMQGNGMMMGETGHKDMGMMQAMGGMRGGGMMMGDEHPFWKQLMGLGLDDKQKDALKTLRAKTMKDMVKRKADQQIAAIELEALLDKDPTDMKAVEAAVKKIESLKTEMFLAHLRAHEEMKTLLTPAQRKQLKEMTEGGRGPAGMMRGMMGGMMHDDTDHEGMQREAAPSTHEHTH